jgi:hypothetical protein
MAITTWICRIVLDVICRRQIYDLFQLLLCQSVASLKDQLVDAIQLSIRKYIVNMNCYDIENEENTFGPDACAIKVKMDQTIAPQLEISKFRNEVTKRY